MPASYISRQPSNARSHPTCWASSQWNHSVSSTPCHGAQTPGPLSAHCLPTANARCPKSRHAFVPAHTTRQFVWQQQHMCGALGGSPTECGIGGQPYKTFIPDTEWPSKEEPGPGLTASAPVSDVSAPACTNGVWPPLRPMSVAQKNKPSTLSFPNVQSIDLLMDSMAWRFWTMRHSNGCSTPAQRSSAVKQWFEELVQKKKK